MQIVITGNLCDSDTRALLEVVNSYYLPNKVLIVHRPGSKSFLSEHLEVLAMTKSEDGKATAYVCDNYTCAAPVNDPKELKRVLKPGMSY